MSVTRAAAVLWALAFVVACGTSSSPQAPTATATPTPVPTPTPMPSSYWVNRVGTTACGLVRGYVAPTATADGRLEIGSHTYVLPSGVRANSAFPITIGSPQCVWGGINAPLGPIGTGSEPLQQWRCGRVRAFVAPNSSTAGHIDLFEYWSLGVVSLPIITSTWPATPPFDAYRCVTTAIDPASGDAVAQGPTDTLADVALACGLVKSFVAPTASTRGSITVGSHAIDLPASTPYQGDPAGSPGDLTAVGQVICFRGIVDDAGVLRRYGPNMMWGRPDASGRISGECGGRGAAFEAPTASDPGLIAYAINRPPYPIPSGAPISTLPPCIVLQLDANGDLFAPAGKTPEPVRL